MSDPLYPLDISFRGERTYLHSTSIFDLLTARTGARSNVKLMFRRMVDKPLFAFDYDPDLPVQFEADGVKLSVGEIDGPPPGREPYDEDSRVGDATITGASIVSTQTTGTVCERFVALNKRLIETVKKPTGKVIFVSMTLATLPQPDDELRVDLDRSAAGLHQSSLYSGGERVGEMIFATLKPKGFAKS